MIDIQSALTEMRTKSTADIERETAWTWASRAVACYRISREHEGDRRVAWLLRYEHYLGEAIEHAAQARDDGETLRAVESEIARRT